MGSGEGGCKMHKKSVLKSIAVVQSLSCVQLFSTAWTVAHQAPLSTGFPRQEYWFSSVQSLSYAQLWDPMNCSTPVSSVLRFLLEFAKIRVRWVSDAIQSSHPLSPPSLFSFNLSLHQGLFQWVSSSHNGQRIGVSASAPMKLQLPMNIQSWFPLGLTGLISLQSKALSRVFSSTIVQKQQFFSTQPSLWSNSHIHTWLLEKS